MSEYIAGIVILALMDLILFLFGLVVYRSRTFTSNRGFPASCALGLAAGALLLHFMALYYTASLTHDRFTVLASTVIFGMFPALIYGMIVRDAFSDKAINIIMGSEDGLDKVNLAKARGYAVNGDLDNARHAYQAFARQYPHSADPLFGLESVYMLEQRYEEAATVCRDILRKFGSDASVRKRAAERLAELLEHNLDDPGGAAIAREESEKGGNVGWQTVQGDREQRIAGRVGVKPTTERFTLEAARQLVRHGETDRAVVVYQKFFELNGTHPRPLFEAVTALEQDGQYLRALEILRDIAGRFSEAPQHWGASTLHQAGIHENYLRDLDAARRILTIVQDRLPGTEHAQVAVDRLATLNSRSAE